MKILYLLTARAPVIPGTEAVTQEVELLRSRFGGDVMSLLLWSRPHVRIPRGLYGLHRLGTLRRLEPEVDLYHIYNPDLYFYPVLRWLKKPIVYTVVSGVRGKSAIPPRALLQRLGAIVVPSRADLGLLAQHGLENGHLVRSGIDLSRFAGAPPATGAEFTLMVGSAPWTRTQFRTKGVDALLRVARQVSGLRLVFLWRGLFVRELRHRVEALGLADRVEVVNEWVDVREVLARVHAAIVLADRPWIVKAYPHSLLEALASGRPVLVSDCIRMAEYVTETGCGEVVRAVDERSLRAAIDGLTRNYEKRRANALHHRWDFSQDGLVRAYQGLYDSITDGKELVRG